MVFEKDREVKSGRRKEAKFFLMPPLWQLLNRARPPTDGELAREIALIDEVLPSASHPKYGQLLQLLLEPNDLPLPNPMPEGQTAKAELAYALRTTVHHARRKKALEALKRGERVSVRVSQPRRSMSPQPGQPPEAQTTTVVTTSPEAQSSQAIAKQDQISVLLEELHRLQVRVQAQEELASSTRTIEAKVSVARPPDPAVGVDPEVDQFLASLGLQEHVSAFAANKVTGAIVKKLTNGDLQSLGVTAVGDRVRFLEAAKTFKGTRFSPYVLSSWTELVATDTGLLALQSALRNEAGVTVSRSQVQSALDAIMSWCRANRDNVDCWQGATYRDGTERLEAFFDTIAIYDPNVDYGKYKAERTLTTEGSTSVEKARAKAAVSSFGRGRGRGRGRGGGRGGGTMCYNCGQAGHMARQCPNRRPSGPNGRGGTQ